MRISKMFSGEGECVDFCEELFPIGNIEDWMQEIERVMRDTVRSVIMAALPDYLEVRLDHLVLLENCVIGNYGMEH